MSNGQISWTISQGLLLKYYNTVINDCSIDDDDDDDELIVLWVKENTKHN